MWSSCCSSGAQYCMWVITSDRGTKGRKWIVCGWACRMSMPTVSTFVRQTKETAIWTRTSRLPNANTVLNGTVWNDSWLDVRNLLTTFRCNLPSSLSLQSKNSLFFDCPASGRSHMLRMVGSKLPIRTAPHQKNCHRHLDSCANSSYERQCQSVDKVRLGHW